MGNAVDLFLVYQFIKKLTTPFENWEAYSAGVIDKDGNIIMDKNERRLNIKAKNSFTKFDLLVLKLKKLINKTPMNNRLSSYAAALWFIKEHQEKGNEDLIIEDFMRYVSLAEETRINRDFEQFFEEPTMSAGGGQVASIGIGPDGEPGFSKKDMERYKNKQKLLKRKRLLQNWSK